MWKQQSAATVIWNKKPSIVSKMCLPRAISKTMSHGFSGGKQMIKAANARNRGRDKTRRRFNSLAKSQISSFDKTYVIIVCCEDTYGAAASKEVTMITSSHDLPLSSLLWNFLYFLLSRVNKLDRDFLHWQLASFLPFYSKLYFTNPLCPPHPLPELREVLRYMYF